MVRDAEHSYLALEEPDEDPMNQLQGHSIIYRIAIGPHQGREVFTLQTLPSDKSHSSRTQWLVFAARQRGAQAGRMKEA